MELIHKRLSSALTCLWQGKTIIRKRVHLELWSLWVLVLFWAALSLNNFGHMLNLKMEAYSNQYPSYHVKNKIISHCSRRLDVLMKDSTGNELRYLKKILQNKSQNHR